MREWWGNSGPILSHGFSLPGARGKELSFLSPRSWTSLSGREEKCGGSGGMVLAAVRLSEHVITLF